MKRFIVATYCPINDLQDPGGLYFFITNVSGWEAVGGQTAIQSNRSIDTMIPEWSAAAIYLPECISRPGGRWKGDWHSILGGACSPDSAMLANCCVRLDAGWSTWTGAAQLPEGASGRAFVEFFQVNRLTGARKGIAAIRLRGSRKR